MCYHVSSPVAAKIKALLGDDAVVEDWSEEHHHVSGFSNVQLPVLTSEQPKRVQAFTWGLIPEWCKDESQARELQAVTLNAKSETAFEKPSFRSISKKRCLVFVDGFFEWREYRKKNYPYFIRLKDQDAFALGGLYENWVNKATGEIINTCSIITTPANAVMEVIHNKKKRMPFMLPKNRMYDWIAPDLSQAQIQQQMQPLPAEALDYWTISKRITSRTEPDDVPEVKAPFHYAELPDVNGNAFDLFSSL